MNDKQLIQVKDLRSSIDGKEILKGVDLEVGFGELHVLMGPNGSGKSTLAQVTMGAPQFKVQSSKFKFDNKDLNKLTPDKRAKLGIFLGFQQPVEVPGVSVFNVLRKAKQSRSPDVSLRAKRSNLDSGQARMTKRESTTSATALYNRITKITDGFSVSAFRQELLEYASSLKLGEDFLRRSLNEGFSGGEKKRNEILQMMALRPKLAILDEIDSGLDVDGLRIVANAIKRFTINNKRSSVILITHYARILKYLKPDFVHVMVDGRIVKSGKAKLAKEVEEKGYGALNAKRLTTKAEHLTINN